MEKEYRESPKSTLKVKSLEDLNIKELHGLIRENNYVCIKGLFKPEVLRKITSVIGKKFVSHKDNPSLGEKSIQIRTNFQKITVGGASLRYNNYPRFFRTFYNPIWAEDIFGMRDIFKELIKARNKIYGIRKVLR